MGAAFFILVFFSAAAALADNSLTRVHLGAGPDYSRLSFTFKEPVESYSLRRDDVSRVTVEFPKASRGRVNETPRGRLVDKIELGQEAGGLTAAIDLAAVRYELRHFLSHDRLTVAIDIKDLEGQHQPVRPEAGLAPPLELPTLAAVAERLLAQLPPPEPEDGAETNLYRRALGRLAIMDNAGAGDDLTLFLSHFPTRPRAGEAALLLSELTFFSGRPEDTYAAAEEMWREALNAWPDNQLARRAEFMRAEADRLSGRNNEAAAKFKILAEDAFAAHSDSIYSRLALLRAVDLLYGLGLLDEGRAMLEPVLAESPADRLGLEAYVRAGMADFYQGFFSQANETFLEALKLNPELYLTYPDMLYAIGEGYHYLERPDLSRRFLFQALNLMPKHPKADVIMARIGDDYRREGLDREAMAIYGAATRNYPHGDGGLISQVRLADMGALHSFFTQDKVFDALERGSRQATVEMYKMIVESGSHSPLMQLAQLKIGTALAEEGENDEAIRWLRDIEFNNPRSSLLPEALPTLSRSLAEEVALRRELEDWQGITDLWADNSSYLGAEEQVPVRSAVAEAYERQDQPGTALEVLKEMAPVRPEDKLARYKKLVELSLQLERPMEVLEFLTAMASEFPQEERQWMEPRMSRVAQALARPADAQASANLVTLVSATDLEPARRTALADAIELDINGARYDSALELMSRYRRDYPDDNLSKEYLMTQAETARFIKKTDQAWAYLAEFRNLYPDDPRSKSNLKEQIAEAQELGRDDDAIAFMDLYRRLYPDDPESRGLLLAKARRQWELERYDASQASFEAFRREYPQDPDLPELMHQRALDDWDRGRYEPARNTWNEMRAAYPDQPLAGKSYVAQYRRAVASDFIEEASALAAEFRRLRPDDPAQADLLLEEAKDLLAAGKTDAALEAWNRFRATYPRDPRNPDLLLIQARQEMKDGRSQDALDHYREFLRRYPDHPQTPEVYLELAAAENRLNLRTEAREHLNSFNAAYRDHPGRPKALLDQAEISRQLGLNDEAANLYRLFRRDYPRAAEVPPSYLAQARLELAAGKPGQAINTLEEGVLAFPELDNDQAVQSLLTQMYLDDGQVEKWAAIVERNLDRGGAQTASSSEKFFKYNQLAQVYQKLGRIEEAERNFDAALASRPADLAPESLYALARSYRDLNLSGKYAEVLKILAASADEMWISIAEKELSDIGAN